MIQTKRIITSKINHAFCNLNEEIKHWNKCLQEYLGFTQAPLKSNANDLLIDNAGQKEKETIKLEKPVAKRMKIKFETRRHWQPKIWR
ncbi:hypothetical protein [Roseivirga sp. UBA838]|uniref:hypothetical protein n=1 Tax=Roseivirga sp. UBA838 TaxID=1947393 RepID=UPI00257C511F|nr:hypothetical protein [Roseivirga sp. UBA838]|tara:strand:- start:45940 stop:46203 length:264 start_codon:yes stop_codon:yes gene_type:complete